MSLNKNLWRKFLESRQFMRFRPKRVCAVASIRRNVTQHVTIVVYDSSKFQFFDKFSHGRIVVQTVKLKTNAMTYTRIEFLPVRCSSAPHTQCNASELLRLLPQDIALTRSLYIHFLFPFLPSASLFFFLFVHTHTLHQRQITGHIMLPPLPYGRIAYDAASAASLPPTAYVWLFVNMISSERLNVG